jgi:butyryl-CoA dehydrogenase
MKVMDKVRHLEAYVSPSSNYSTRKAFTDMSIFSKPLVHYEPMDLWEQDTEALPKALANYRREVRLFAEQQLKPIAMKMDKMAHSESGELNPELQSLLIKAAKQGFFSDMLPAPIGSVPLSRYRYPLAWQQAIKVEELARSCGGLMLLLSAHNLGIAPLLMAGDLAAARKFLLPALKENNAGKPHLFAFAITEPSAGSDVEEGHGASLYKPGTVARKVEGGWSISGRKCFISGGDVAQSMTVFAALEGEGIESWTCFLVTKDMPGFSVARTELKMGMRASSAAELEFDNVIVPDDHVIGGLRKGWGINRSILNLSRLPVAAMAVGFAQAATDIAMEFVCRYSLAGKPLIEYQETQLSLAQMIADTSAIRSLVWQSSQSWVSTQGRSALNKFYCTDLAVKVCENAMEMMSNHGGFHDNAAEKAFRDARLTQIFEGTNQINRLALIEDIQEQLMSKMV